MALILTKTCVLKFIFNIEPFNFKLIVLKIIILLLLLLNRIIININSDE